MSDIQPTSLDYWRTYHNYSGGNSKQICSKCGRTLLAKNQNFSPTREWTDKNPICPVKDTSNLKQLLRNKGWYGIPPNSFFCLEYKPYAIVQIKLENLL